MQQVLNASTNVDNPCDEEDKVPSIRSSIVWQYATRSNDRNYAICNLCPVDKRISANNGSTSTLRRHLISKHGKTELIVHDDKTKTPSISISSQRKKYLHDLLINCIVRDGRVFRDFEKPGIRQVLTEAFPGESDTQEY